MAITIILFAVIDLKTLPSYRANKNNHYLGYSNDKDSLFIFDSADLYKDIGDSADASQARAESAIGDSLKQPLVVITNKLSVKDTLRFVGRKVKTASIATNTIFGNGAGNPSGASNSLFGYTSGYSLTTGASNSLFGLSAGRTMTDGTSNAFFGTSAGYYNNGDYNVFIGHYAGFGATSTTDYNGNVAVGYRSGNALMTKGNFNSFLGYFSGRNTTTGHHNIFLGDSTGVLNTTGSNNIYMGRATGGSSATCEYELNIGNAIKGDMRDSLDIVPKIEFKDSTYLSNGKEIRTQITNQVKAYPDSLYRYYFEKNTETSKKILMLGSSITWGSGSMNDTVQSATGYMVKDLIKKYANGLYSNELTYAQGCSTITNPKFINRTAKRIKNVNSTVKFSLYGNEIVIGQIIQRTTNYATISVYADGLLIGKFTNKNPTMGSGSDSFTGDGVNNNFTLSSAYTYGHTLTVGGSPWNVIIHSGDISAGYEYDDGTSTACIVRGWDENGNVKHKLIFETPPALGAAIEINYNYGKHICIEGSTVGQMAVDSLNECNYGIGGTSWDPLAPKAISSGLEFRDIDQKSIWSYKFSGLYAKPKLHKYEIKITGGVNPYFAINYVTNRNHYLVNAGIGGFDLNTYLDGTYPNLSYKKLLEKGIPDIIFLQPGCGSDGTDFKTRKVRRIITGETEAKAKSVCTRGEVDSIKYISSDNFTIRYCTGLIDSIANNYLVSHHIFSSDSANWGTVAPGDIVRIGNYHGEWREIQTRKIRSVDIASGKITWDRPLFESQLNNIDTLAQLIGKEFSVRDLSLETARTDSMLNYFHNCDPNIKIVLVTSENSNYFKRQSWGYDIAQQEATKGHHNIEVAHMDTYLQEKVETYISGHTAGTEIYITADGSTSYTLSTWTGLWQGFAVYVNGENVYGKDCYITIGGRYGVNPALTGSRISITGAYQGVSITEGIVLTFFRNIPPSGTITVQRADFYWSGDLTHPNYVGGKWYSEMYLSKIFEK